MKIEYRVFAVLCMLLFAVAPGTRAERMIYVDADASAGGDGSNWAAAFKYLQDALAVADANDEIRVAQGTYLPDRSSADPGGSGDRAATFQPSETVAIRGGYAGYGEPDPDARDIDAYETILSGDLLGNDVACSWPGDLLNEPTRSDNCYHVVTGADSFEPVAVILDGLTIAGGQADSAEGPGPSGGGMYVQRCTPILAHCTFKNNCASYSGGGLYDRRSDHTASISNCSFIGNAAHSGGGASNSRSERLTVVNCFFAGNVATDRGGGMFSNRESAMDLKNCVFFNNSASAEGGGIYSDDSHTNMINCMLSGNFAGRNGGGMCHNQAKTWLSNCTIVGNEAGEQGGGVFDSVDRDRYVTNCILWANRAYEGPQMAINYEVNLIISHSCLQGGLLDINIGRGSTVYWAEGNNTDADPKFTDPGHWDVGAWVAGDYHLKSQAGRWDANDGRWTTDEVTSPCIDAGDPNSDWTAELWPHGKRINMGAFGGTNKASMSLSSLGNVADMDESGRVDYLDMRLLAYEWLRRQVLLPEDLNRDSIVNFFDFAEFVEEWLWQGVQ